MSKASKASQRQLEHTIFTVALRHAAIGLDADELEIVIQWLITTMGHPIALSAQIEEVTEAISKNRRQVTHYIGTMRTKGLLSIDTQGYDPSSGRPIRTYDLSPLLHKIGEEVSHE